MKRIPTRKNTFRLDGEDLARALGAFEDRRLRVELQDTLWITPQPRMPVAHVFYEPRHWASRLLDNAFIAALSQAVPPVKEWAKESWLEEHLQPFAKSGDAITDGVRALEWAMRTEATSCTGVVRYDLHERDDMTGTTFLIVTLKPQVGVSMLPMRSFTAALDFGGKIRGGDLLAVFRFAAGPLAPLAGFIKLKVRGRNPPKETVRDELDRAAHEHMRDLLAVDKEVARQRLLALKILVCHESGFTQFYGEGDPRIRKYLRWVHRYRPSLEAKDVPGLPIVGWSNERTFHGGFGLMQLDNPEPSAEEVWSWRANIDAGVRLYASYARIALRELKELHRKWARHGAKWFREDELRKEFWVKYNSGPRARHWSYWHKQNGWQAGGYWPFKSDYPNHLAGLFDRFELYKTKPPGWD